MLFKESLLEFIAENPIEGLVQACEIAKKLLDPGEAYTENDFDVLFEAFALLTEIIESNALSSSTDFPALSGDPIESAKELYKFVNSIQSEFQIESNKLKLEVMKSKYRSALGSGFFYEFSQGDIERIQVLVSELRENVSASKQIDAEHKTRLLKRLEKLQSEIHKKVSDLDRFWGLIGDAGVAFGKLGSDAKPLVDRIREITDIIWRTQSRREELPTDTPSPFITTQKSNTSE